MLIILVNVLLMVKVVSSELNTLHKICVDLARVSSVVTDIINTSWANVEI